VAKALLDAGARIDERCEYGTTALHMAVCWAHPDMVEFLIARGGDLQAQDDEGRTPLEMARALGRNLARESRDRRSSAERADWVARIRDVVGLLSTHQS
jgi:ankyrin repeat protein